METAKVKVRLESDKERRAMLRIERRLLALSGIQDQYIQVSDLFINETEYIHCITVNKVNPIVTEEKNNVILFLHGYGGFGAVYYKILGQLAENFYCVAIDAPGMGFSSRAPNVPFDSTDSCIDYFVSKIKAFVDTYGLTKFNIIGHSLGGYMAGHFFEQYHEQVEKLILLSPAGMNIPYTDQQERFNRFADERGFFASYFIKSTWKKIFKKKKSPFELMFWPFKTVFLRMYLGAKRFNFTPDEKELLFDLMKYFISQPACGDKCIGYLLYYGMQSQRPVIKILSKMHARSSSVMIMYGEFDWMDKNDTIENLRELNLEIKVTMAMGADHQIPFQNCADVKREILLVFGEEPPIEQTEYFEVQA